MVCGKAAARLARTLAPAPLVLRQSPTPTNPLSLSQNGGPWVLARSVAVAESLKT